LAVDRKALGLVGPFQTFLGQRPPWALTGVFAELVQVDETVCERVAALELLESRPVKIFRSSLAHH